MNKLYKDVEGVLVEFSPEDYALLELINKAPLPTVVTMRQARLALLQQGLLSQVQLAIDSLPSPQKEAAQIEWEYATEVRRDSSLVQNLSVGLDLTDEQIDSLFLLASTL